MLIVCTVYIINSGLTLMGELEDKEAELTGKGWGEAVSVLLLVLFWVDFLSEEIFPGILYLHN